LGYKSAVKSKPFLKPALKRIWKPFHGKIDYKVFVPLLIGIEGVKDKLPMKVEVDVTLSWKVREPRGKGR